MGFKALFAYLSVMGAFTVYETQALPPAPALAAFAAPAGRGLPPPRTLDFSIRASLPLPSPVPGIPPAAKPDSPAPSWPEALRRSLLEVLQPRRELSDIPLPRIVGAERSGRQGLGYRIDFLDARGLSRLGPEGLNGFRRSQRYEEPRFQAAREFWGTYALYFAQDEVNFELELVNNGSRPIEALKLAARVESFDPAQPGAYRAPVSFDEPGPIRLKPGERRAVRGRFVQGEVQGSDLTLTLSQIHLVAFDEGERAVLADDQHAGLFDPPGS